MKEKILIQKKPRKERGKKYREKKEEINLNISLITINVNILNFPVKGDKYCHFFLSSSYMPNGSLYKKVEKYISQILKESWCGYVNIEKKAFKAKRITRE